MMKTNIRLASNAWKNNEPAASSSIPYQKNSPTFSKGCRNCVINVIKLKAAPTVITAEYLAFFIWSRSKYVGQHQKSTEKKH